MHGDISVFDKKLEEYANELTYDEFMQIVMISIQSHEKIINMWERDLVRFVVSHDSIHPGETFLYVISPDISWDEECVEKEYPGYSNYIMRSYVDDRNMVFMCLYWSLDLFNTPPALWEKKKMIDRELRPLDYATIKERIRIPPESFYKKYISAEHIVTDFDLCKANSDIEWFYFKYRYDFCNPLIIMGIDLYRGQEREQKIIAELVRISCLTGSRIIFQLWDTDAGFETLKIELAIQEEKGQVLYERSRYNENFSGEDVDD